jgi:hypothetical protein
MTASYLLVPDSRRRAPQGVGLWIGAVNPSPAVTLDPLAVL